MALQIEVQHVSATKGKKNVGLTVVFNLTCWPDGVVKEYPVRNVDGTIDMKNAVLFKDFSQYIKANVEGKTKEEILFAVLQELKNIMQDSIDSYIKEQELLNSTRLEQARQWLESNLDGGV